MTHFKEVFDRPVGDFSSSSTNRSGPRDCVCIVDYHFHIEEALKQGYISPSTSLLLQALSPLEA